MANTIARLASVFQKARDLLSAQYIRSVLRGLSVLGGGRALAKLISLAEELFVGRYLGVQVVAQSFKLAPYKIRIVVTQTSFIGPSRSFFLSFFAT
jgi:hypothetical protein